MSTWEKKNFWDKFFFSGGFVQSGNFEYCRRNLDEFSLNFPQLSLVDDIFPLKYYKFFLLSVFLLMTGEQKKKKNFFYENKK